MPTRADLEAREAAALAPWAMRSRDSRGRRHAEPEHPLRMVFQRDRDRIIHSTAFRRLEYKTQVFVNHEGDYYRTRLTHTIEAAQVTRTLARALGLNEDLAEAVALAHDLGHTPFGHAGERTLDRLMKPHGRSDHRAHVRWVPRLYRRVGAHLAPRPPRPPPRAAGGAPRRRAPREAAPGRVPAREGRAQPGAEGVPLRPPLHALPRDPHDAEGRPHHERALRGLHAGAEAAPAPRHRASARGRRIDPARHRRLRRRHDRPLRAPGVQEALRPRGAGVVSLGGNPSRGARAQAAGRARR